MYISRIAVTKPMPCTYPTCRTQEARCGRGRRIAGGQIRSVDNGQQRNKYIHTGDSITIARGHNIQADGASILVNW